MEQKMWPILLNSNNVWIPNMEYFLDDTSISELQPSEGMIIWQDSEWGVRSLLLVWLTIHSSNDPMSTLLWEHQSIHTEADFIFKFMCISSYWKFLRDWRNDFWVCPFPIIRTRLLATFRFISTTPTELGAAVLTFVRHDMDYGLKIFK